MRQHASLAASATLAASPSGVASADGDRAFRWQSGAANLLLDAQHRALLLERDDPGLLRQRTLPCIELHRWTLPWRFEYVLNDSASDRRGHLSGCCATAAHQFLPRWPGHTRVCDHCQPGYPCRL